MRRQIGVHFEPLSEQPLPFAIHHTLSCGDPFIETEDRRQSCGLISFLKTHKPTIFNPHSSSGQERLTCAGQG